MALRRTRAALPLLKASLRGIHSQREGKILYSSVLSSSTCIEVRPGSKSKKWPLHGRSVLPCGASSFSSAAASGSSQMEAIKQLRERTGAPMKDVKNVLVDCLWDLETAFTELRKRGLAAASKKKGRISAEGLLGLAEAESGRTAAVVEVNSETDFVARNDIFQHLVLRVAQAALQVEGEATVPGGGAPLALSALEACRVKLEHEKLNGESSVREAIAELAAITGENIRLRRGFRVDCPQGIVCSYLHTSPRPGLARIASLVAIQGADGSVADVEAVRQLGSQLAMHSVAARPLYLTQELVDPAALAKERDILKTQAETSGKPVSVVDKMVEGRLRKFYEDVVLLNQKFVMDDSVKVQALLATAGKTLGVELNVPAFLRMEVGEGIERVESDFAAEVAAQVAGV